MDEDSGCSHLLFQKAHDTAMSNNLLIFMAPVELLNDTENRGSMLKSVSATYGYNCKTQRF